MIVGTGPTYCAVQLAKDAPLSCVKVWYGAPLDPITGEELDRSPRWQLVLNGEQVDFYSVIIEVYENPRSAVIKGHAITEDEYSYMLQVREWAVAHSPDAPEAKPREAINHLQGDLIF